MQFSVSDACKKTYPQAAMGVLVVDNILNIRQSDDLNREKEKLVILLCEQYRSREEIKADLTLQAYADYYKIFKKNYHVFFQLESVAVKGKPIPNVNALVEAMFMAELQHGLLTAGHDGNLVTGDVVLDCATGTERYMTLSGEEKTLKAKDMYVRDGEGVLSSIIYGPDQRTRINMGTCKALFTVYAPAGIQPEKITVHMQAIYDWIRLFSPSLKIEKMHVHAFS